MTEQSNPQNNNNEKRNDLSKGWLGYIPYLIAIAAMIAYGFFISFLIGKVGAQDPDWSRLIYLFSGVEAIVFAAAGFLFGREVNRKRAERAENDKQQAENQKEQAKKQVVEERKKALILGAMCIQGEQTSLGATDQRVALEGVTPEKNPLGSIADKARRMYPELKD